MKSSTRLLFCALFSALLGCGGGSSGNAVNSTPPPPPATIAVIAGPEAFVIPPSGQASLLSSVEGSSNQADQTRSVSTMHTVAIGTVKSFAAIEATRSKAPSGGVSKML